MTIDGRKIKADYKLPANGSRPLTADSRLLTADCRLPFNNFSATSNLFRAG
jgi:hypothetical protein